MAVVSGQLVENGQCESPRLAGAGLGDAQHIPATQKFGDGLRLDRRRNVMVSVVQRALDRIGEAEFRKIHMSHLGIPYAPDGADVIINASETRRFFPAPGAAEAKSFYYYCSREKFR